MSAQFWLLLILALFAGGGLAWCALVAGKRVEIALNDQWLTAPMRCDRCGHEWVAVAPVCADYLECSKCHWMQPAPVAGRRGA